MSDIVSIRVILDDQTEVVNITVDSNSLILLKDSLFLYNEYEYQIVQKYYNINDNVYVFKCENMNRKWNYDTLL
jgi:3-deoxy-D-manno-octulosonic acid (KDO) 8-phosphate synthase